MKRTLTVIGAAAVVIMGAAALQAQGRTGAPGPADQRAVRPAMRQMAGDFGCGPNQGIPGRGQGMQAGRRGPRGLDVAPGRGPRAGRPGGMGRLGGPGRMGGRGLCGLDLTEAQQDQIKALREESRQKLESLLTPEQLAKFRARRGGGSGPEGQ